MTVVWSPRAIRHLVHVREYIAQEDPAAAARVGLRILECVELLTRHPEVGRPGRLAGTRELVVPRTPYVIPYRLKAARLEILAVLHVRQRWPERP
jgi:toxin ParE1/3/4